MAFLLKAERVILADTFAYSRQSYMNRTRIRTPQGWQWLTVPVVGGQKGRPLCQVEVVDSAKWRRQHQRALLYNYRSAPFYPYYEEHLHHFFYEQSWSTLGELVIASIRWLLECLDWEGPGPEIASEKYPHALSLETLIRASETRELLTLPESMDHDRAGGVAVRPASFKHPQYYQNFEGFVPGMSLLDCLFNYGPDTRYLLEQALTLEAAVDA